MNYVLLCLSLTWFSHLTYITTRSLIVYYIFYRCMCVKIVATPRRNRKCTIFIWKTTTLSVRHCTNSTTRGISSSQIQILPACCSRSILKQNKNKSGHDYFLISCKKGRKLVKYVGMLFFSFFILVLIPCLNKKDKYKST